MRQNMFTYSCTSLYSACVVQVWCMYGENTTIVRCLLGACLVLVWCVHDQEYSKEEQETRTPSETRKAVISSNKKAAWVNTMVLKATLFWIKKKQEKYHNNGILFYDWFYSITAAIVVVVVWVSLLLLLLSSPCEFLCCCCCYCYCWVALL